jgi:tRNA nucleotidyltransferase (CCA-adding enzyme)
VLGIKPDSRNKTDAHQIPLYLQRADQDDRTYVVNTLSLSTLVTLFARCDALRKPQRFEQMLRAAECDFRGRGNDTVSFHDKPFPQAAYLMKALGAARSIDAGAVARRFADKPERIPEAVHAARVAAVKALLHAD